MNLLRGAKAIADKIDIGFIALEVTQEDLEKIKPVLTKNNFPAPNIKMSVYKNRANGYKGIYLWMCADKGICRYNTVFVTTWDYRVVDIEDIKFKIKEEREF
jgi:replicative DNA helicase